MLRARAARLTKLARDNNYVHSERDAFRRLSISIQEQVSLKIQIQEVFRAWCQVLLVAETRDNLSCLIN